MAKQKPEFNKVAVLDEFMQAMQLPPKPLMSDTLRIIVNSQNRLQKIHDDAFELGFEKGLEATKTVDNL